MTARHSSAGGGTDLASDRSRRGDIDAITGPARPASTAPVAGSPRNAAPTEPTHQGPAAVSLVCASTREGRRSITGEGDPGGGSLACRPPASTTTHVEAPAPCAAARGTTEEDPSMTHTVAIPGTAIGDAHHDPDLRSHLAATNLTVHLNHGWNVDAWVDRNEPGWGAARLVIGRHIDVSIHGSADELAAVADRIHAAAAEIRSAER